MTIFEQHYLRRSLIYWTCVLLFPFSRYTCQQQQGQGIRTRLCTARGGSTLRYIGGNTRAVTQAEPPPEPLPRPQPALPLPLCRSGSAVPAGAEPAPAASSAGPGADSSAGTANASRRFHAAADESAGNFVPRRCRPGAAGRVWARRPSCPRGPPAAAPARPAAARARPGPARSARGPVCAYSPQLPL